MGTAVTFLRENLSAAMTLMGERGGCLSGDHTQQLLNAVHEYPPVSKELQLAYLISEK